MQAVGVKDEAVPDQAVKKPNGGGKDSNSGEVVSSSPAELSNAVSSPHSEAAPFSSRSKENAEPSCSKSSSIVAAQVASNLKHSIRPLAPVGAPFILNRYKLDNRPTAFKILPPLPSGLANVISLTPENLVSVLNSFRREKSVDISYFSFLVQHALCLAFFSHVRLEI